MRILFIQENGYYESIGVMYISAFLKRNGHAVDLLIASEERDLFRKMKEFHPDFIAISCTTDMHQWVVSMAKKCKLHLRTPVIVGGPHPTCFPEIIKEKAIDMICRGDGEYALLELANRFDRGESLTDIPGIWAKKGAKVYKNPPGPLIQDFSDFPVPDRELYYKYGFIKDMPMKRFITGRGCPFLCAFCHNQLLKRIYSGRGIYVRKMPVYKIIHEIEEVRKKYPLTSVHFSDDTFVLNPRWVMDFCTVYKKRIHLPFSCNVRADLINETVLKVLSAAGCRAVSFGVESGNEKIRNRVLHKNITNTTIVAATALLRKYHIKFLTTNMVGIPGETIQDVYDTVRFNRHIRPDFTRCFIFDAFPGLPLTYYAIKLGILPGNYSLKQFSALSHNPVIKNIQPNILQNICSLFPFFVNRTIPLELLSGVASFPYMNITYMTGRLYQAYIEMKFFRIPLIPGLRYALHSLRSFNSN